MFERIILKVGEKFENIHDYFIVYIIRRLFSW
ncbi:hypothetical protein J2Y02_001379 [Neobacillus drentensis]|nr:hypothetical protein [Neobacillus drentensis]